MRAFLDEHTWWDTHSFSWKAFLQCLQCRRAFMKQSIIRITYNGASMFGVRTHEVMGDLRTWYVLPRQWKSKANMYHLLGRHLLRHINWRIGSFSHFWWDNSRWGEMLAVVSWLDLQLSTKSMTREEIARELVSITLWSIAHVLNLSWATHFVQMFQPEWNGSVQHPFKVDQMCVPSKVAQKQLLLLLIH